ncbi:MAG: Imm52 family immunity protein [Pseudomonadota bacterium]
MTHPDYSLVCTWGARSQTAQEIAHDVMRFSLAVLEVCPALQAWHYLAPKDKLVLLPDTVDEIRLKVLRPGNGARRGVAPDLILPVGFSALLLTSKKIDAACWMGHTGSDGGGLGSRVAINCPRRGDLAQVMTEPDMMERLFRIMVEVWQPDWARVSHTDMSDPEYAFPVHWMLYGREPLPPGLVLPDGVEVHGLTGASGEVLAPGQYFVTTPGERFVYSHPEHQARCEALKRVLREAGWLPPAPVWA